MTSKTIDLRQDTQYDLLVNKNYEIKSYLTAQYYSGDTSDELINFDYATYDGAELVVKQRSTSNNPVLTFSTNDGSIVLYENGVFGLFKTTQAMKKIAAGEYLYSMFLHKGSERRAFLSGKFTIESKIF